MCRAREFISIIYPTNESYRVYNEIASIPGGAIDGFQHCLAIRIDGVKIPDPVEEAAQKG